MSQLKILKASAGSGKTFNLVAEYIKLLVENPYNYRYILAVTFTNKATAEMKERVVRDLFKLANGENDVLLNILAGQTHLPFQKIADNARLALSNILHDYDRFSVSTIDSFFQRVLRSFARETGLYGTYEVELDYDAVLNEAADRLLISVEDDEDLRIWLTEMSEDQLSEGKNWSIKEKILELGKELQKEAYQQYMLSSAASDENENDMRKHISALKNELIKTRKWFEKEICELGKSAVSLIENHGLQLYDFKYKKASFANLFYKLNDYKGGEISVGKRFLGAIDDVDTWGKKNDIDKMQSLYNDGLNELMHRILDFLEKNYPLYVTAYEIYKHIFSLGVLSVLLSKIREIGRENNSLLLNEGTLLLKGIIGSNDAPFIYEKTGSYYRYFMIDEFQDTSDTQWQNFKPLVINSLAENNPNLIVGDVKQSIYRWRNSDWQLLNKHIQEELKTFRIEEHKLQQNWRSRENLIAFNNAFFISSGSWLQAKLNDQFDEAAQPLPDEFRSTVMQVYDDVEQKVTPGKTGGYINLQFIDGEEKDDYRVETLERIISAVKNVQQQGYNAGDIAVLVRTNFEGKMVADALLNQKKISEGYNFEVVSDDSLFIYTSPAVKLIIGLMQHIIKPFDQVVMATLVYEFSQHILPSLKAKNKLPQRLGAGGQQSMVFEAQKDESFFSEQVKEEFFPFFDPEADHAIVKNWSNLSIANFIEELVKTYNLDYLEGEQAAIQSLKDTVNDFSRRESGNMHKFLDWWEQYGSKVKVQMSVSRDAIRILTVHKAKGLEFPVVLLPFCDWDFKPSSKQGNIMWCPTGNTPFKQFPALPVKVSSRLKSSLFSREYYNELLLTAVDTINLLYVALTRAVDAIFVFSEKPKAPQNGEMSFTANTMIFETISNISSEPAIEEYAEDSYEGGILPVRHNVKNEGKEEVDLSAHFVRKKNALESLKLRRNYDDFLESEAPEWVQHVNEGKFMHELLALVETADDVEKAMGQMQSDGKVSNERYGSLKDSIYKLLDNPEAKHWFDGSFTVLNEISVLGAEFGNLRPDRVMTAGNKAIVVDYKATETRNNKYEKQVSRYASIIRDMGYERVEGYIWYLKSNSIQRVVGT
jgi:ATP-dependent exoDNAse (exonuclease V) beta subunit